MTKDERFLIELYRKLRENPDGVCDPRLIAKELNYNERLMKNILKGLMQANLVKRYSDEEVGLTERGREVAESLY
jgi:DNA-binding MarR family transcriptional regulator